MMSKMDRNRRKALVLDIDGTLTTTKKEITDRTRAKIWQVLDAGHRVVLASGRPTPGMARYAKELELKERGGYLLSFNGARVVDCTSGDVVFQLKLPTEIPAELYAFAKANGMGLITYRDNEIISAFEPDEYVLWEAKINNLPVKKVEDFASYVDFPVNKCLLTAPDEQAARMEQILAERYGDRLSIYRSEPFFLEVMPQGVDKASSLDKMLDALDVERRNTICCGDGYNDISMIRYAGLGVAMGNARQAVRDAADYITGTNDEDGLVEVMDKYIIA